MQILFITQTRIGDVVLSSGLLRHLVGRYPDARITIACGTIAVPLFAATPNVERVIPVRKQRFDGHWFALWRDVRRTRWDLVIDLRKSLLAYFIRARERRVLGPTPPIPWVRHLSNLLDLAEPASPHIYTTADHAAAAARHIPDGAPVLALAPVAALAHKMWPAADFAAFLQSVLAGRCRDWRVAVFGGPGDEAAAQAVLAAVPPAQRISIFHEPDLLVVAATLARCRAFVGNDSGLSHLAAAMGVPTFALFGRSNFAGYAPWGPYCRAVQAPGPQHRITDLTLDAVLAGFNALPLPP